MPTLYMITGATGHLGNTIVSQLLQSNQNVRILALPHDTNIPHGVQVCYGDVTNRDSLIEFFDTDAYTKHILIHCAAVVSIADKLDPLATTVNVGGTRNIIDMAIAHQIDKVVYVSSVHAIAEPSGNNAITETSNFSADTVHGAYAKSKAEATAYVLSQCDKIDISIVHPSGIIGPNDNLGGNLTKMIADYYSGRLSVGVAGGYDFVDVRDVSAGIINCCNYGKQGHCYILSNNYYTVSQLYQAIDNTICRKRHTPILPLWIAKLFAPISEALAGLFRQKTSFTKYSIYTLGAKSKFSHTKATKQLGYKPRPITDTIRDTILWLQRTLPAKVKC